MAGKMIGVAVVAAALPIGAVALAQATGMQPGLWEFVSTPTAVAMPGAPPAVANMMRGRSTTFRHCVTPKEVADGPQAALKNNKSCTVNFHIGMGGRFTSVMMCNDKGGNAVNATTSGTMSATSFMSTSRMVMSGGRPMTITSNVTGRKVGECKG